MSYSTDKGTDSKMPPIQVLAHEVPATAYASEKKEERAIRPVAAATAATGGRGVPAGNAAGARQQQQQRRPRGGGAVGNAHAATQGARPGLVPARDRTRDGGDRDLSHLLSFTLPPRQHPPPRTSRRSGRTATGWHNTRERYLNAQYRFMLKPTGDYTVHFADPDIYFNWPDVLQVIVPTSSVLPAAAHSFEGPSTSNLESLLPSCPICLSEPVAPRMTKCGHIFCYPCLLHYLEMSDTGQKCRSCPICYDTVYPRDLKSVKWFDPVSAASQAQASSTVDHSLSNNDENLPGDTPNSRTERDKGTFITMRLIQRTNISTLALPKSATWPSDILPPHSAPWYFAPDIMTFSRFMLATPEYMEKELRGDLRQLEEEHTTLRRLGTPPDDLGIVFIDSARRKVGEQIEKVALLRTDMVLRSSENVRLELEALHDREGAEQRRRQRAEEMLAVSSTSAEETDEYVPPVEAIRNDSSAYSIQPRLGTAGPATSKATPARSVPAHPASSTNRHQRHRRNVNPPAPNDATYLFYQAASGQHIYLHPLDIKILKSHFETYSAFPLAIRIRVEGTEEGSMNEDLRKRCRYLAHLPEACDLTFVEADLSSFVSQSTLSQYAQALKKRTAKRRERARKDDKARIKSEQAAAERERDLIYRSSRTPDASALGVPAAYTQSWSEPSPNDETSFPGLGPTSSREADPDCGGETAEGTRSSAAAAPAEPLGGRKTVWGTRAVAASQMPNNRQDEEDHLDTAVENAWNDFDAMQQRGGRRQGRKKKVVLNLSGGTMSMRR